jgi:hypothetical protein
VGVNHPEDSFIWWIEACRSSRQPDKAGLARKIEQMFRKAWPERLTRMFSHIGIVEMRGREPWIVAQAGQEGAVNFGPYAPLPAGDYVCRFELEAPNGGAPEGWGEDRPDVRCDVVADKTVVAQTELIIEPSGSTVVMRFSLDRLTFGVQFRCFSTGRREISCRRRVDLITVSGGVEAAIVDLARAASLTGAELIAAAR